MSATDEEDKPPSRRQFIAGLTAGVAGGLVAARVVTSSEREPAWDRDADVVVVGGGASGCTAALSAAEGGAKVVLLETLPMLGGAGSVCVGSITVPLSSLQKRLGIRDSVDAYMQDVLNNAHQASRMDMRLLRLLAEEGGATIDWLIGHGVNIQGPFDYPIHRVKRMHVLVPKAAEWPKVLRPVLQRKGVDVLTETKGNRLYQNTAGRVLGVQAVDLNTNRTMAIKARRAVMLTAGNLEANPALMARSTTPEIAAMPPAVISRDGSGLVMAWAIGAASTMLDCISTPQVRGAPPGPSVFSLGKQAWMPYGMVDAGAILVNRNGQRFTDETVQRVGDESVKQAALSLELEKQPYKTCYLIFDKRVADLFNKWPMVVGSSQGIGEVSGIGGWALVDDLIARHGIRKADTIEELAAAVGVDPAGLKAGIEKWNGNCRAGKDPEFKRRTFGNEDANTVGAGIRVPPFYCHSPLRNIVLPADTSLAINTRLQVAHVFGTVIPGLYAGGDMGHGDLLLDGISHGLKMGWAFTSGRLGGKQAAAEAPWG
ncbi:MAG TPA: FAD-dependent oxidoreductase [Steroidobacteraceae bacterium]|jgi:fumarate reductase flavoprotein subunit|nr:FAD-dependent oxidoreductase [Steroidobacteraceae bacterium]